MENVTHTHVKASCDAGDCASGKRNRFFRNKTMKAEDFAAEQSYFIDRRRLLNRAVSGWGVVYGFGLAGPRVRTHCCEDEAVPAPAVPPEKNASPAQQTSPLPSPQEEAPPAPSSITVQPGLGLDRHGREIVVAAAVQLTSANAFLLERSAGSGCVRLVDAAKPGRYVLSIHYAERQFGNANLPQTCACDRPEKNFVCETAVFALRVLDECARCPCGEPACRGCNCGCDACRAEGRGSHACLCQWVTEGKIAGTPPALCEWNGYWIDPGDGIDLACVTIAPARDKCAPLQFDCIDDACGPRRLVKSNDLLYDLMRGCDLTRIAWISWGAWHRNPVPMPWKEFVRLIGPPVDPDDSPSALTELRIRFSGPVQANTVTTDCFAIFITVSGEDTGWYEKRVIPVVGLSTTADPNDPPNTVREVQLAIASTSQEEALQHAGKLRSESATVDVDVYGDYILDCGGQAVDANARGFALFVDDHGDTPAPSGNGTPGGTLHSVFRIEQRPGSKRSS